jgi:hypothetical protein
VTKPKARLTSIEVDELLQSDKDLSPNQVRHIGERIKMEDVVEKAEQAKVTPAWLVRQRKRNLREQLRRLGRLKRGQVYVVQWPKVGWVNGHPTTWTKFQGKTPLQRWQEFLKDNPPALYHDSGCLPDEADGGSGMMFEVLKVNAYELAGVPCGGCGGELEDKALDRERRRARAVKARVRKPTKPRDLVTVAQVRKRMAEEAKRVERITKGKSR